MKGEAELEEMGHSNEKLTQRLSIPCKPDSLVKKKKTTEAPEQRQAKNLLLGGKTQAHLVASFMTF